MKTRITVFKVSGFLAVFISFQAMAAPQGYIDLKPGVTLESGDTWVDQGQKYRLYGAQACLRGTSYTDKSSVVRDCGDASLAVFAAYIKDTHPLCAPTAKTTDVTYVMCISTVGDQHIDLGTALITNGYAFAALNDAGMPFLPQYAVAEQSARNAKIGLWQFKDVQHPAILLSTYAALRSKEAHP